MENVIVIAIIILAAIGGICYTVKHFKGQGGCCGGGDYKVKRKKLSAVIYQKTFQVNGMHCSHCKNKVEQAVNDIQGISGKVDLKKGQLTVSYAQQVDDRLIKSRIERAGYTVDAE